MKERNALDAALEFLIRISRDRKRQRVICNAPSVGTGFCIVRVDCVE
jgi:hypothetical protein